MNDNALREAAIAAGITPIDATLCLHEAAYARALEDRLRRITWKSFHYPPTWTVRPMDIGSVSVTIAYTVPDRDTGKPLRVQEGEAFMVRPFEPEDLVHYARARVRRFVLHEVDEAIHVGGARVFDPHEKDAP